jgi:ubiquinol-cytochrome c reductase cytochrome b subunit
MSRRAKLEMEERTDPPTTPFFPNFILIEALAALGMLVVIVVVASLAKPSLEPAVNQASGYVPRPEWYFLWFFELLKFFRGSLEPVATFLLPTLVIVAGFLLPFVDRRPPKTRALVPGTRPVRVAPRVVGAVLLLGLGSLTLAAATGPRPEPPEPMPSPISVPEWP